MAFSYNTLVEADDDVTSADLPDRQQFRDGFDMEDESSDDEGDHKAAVTAKCASKRDAAELSRGRDVAEDWERAYMGTACRLLGEEKSFEEISFYKDSKASSKYKTR
jgi:hypothetical protein